MSTPFEIRADWAFEVAAASQHLVGSIAVSDPASFTRAFETLSSDIRDCASPAERIFLADRVAALAIRAGYQFDLEFHKRYALTACDGRVLGRTLGILSDAPADPMKSVRIWSAAFLQEFGRYHTWPIGEHVRRYVEEHYQESIDWPRLAKRFGYSRSALARAFVAATGSTLQRYHAALRVRTAIMILREQEWKIDAVASIVGYRSPKNFYRALRTSTGLSPAEVRRLESERLEQILSSLLERR